MDVKLMMMMMMNKTKMLAQLFIITSKRSKIIEICNKLEQGG